MKKLKAKFIRLAREQRLHQLEVPIVGLTGGIATGKSTVSRMLEQEGLNVIDADKLVKKIYALQETIDFITNRYPQSFQSGSIHFPTLREIFFKDQNAKKEIENYIYQRLPAAFHQEFERQGKPELVIYDVPLLFEKGLDKSVDLKVLVYAPREIQRARLMERDGILEPLAETILSQQMDIEVKKGQADFIISNTSSLTELTEEVQQFLRQILDQG